MGRRKFRMEGNAGWSKMSDYAEWLKIYCVNGGVLAAVSLSDVEAVLKIVALMLTIAWTAVKIVKLIKDN